MEIKLSIHEIDVNRMAQHFHDNCEGLTQAGVHEKPKIIAGLTAVFEALGIQVVS